MFLDVIAHRPRVRWLMSMRRWPRSREEAARSNDVDPRPPRYPSRKVGVVKRIVDEGLERGALRGSRLVARAHPFLKRE